METRPIKVLLVEDNPGDARLFQEHLRMPLGTPCEVSITGSTAEAEAALRAGTFDIVLTDLTLPDCRGLESFRRLESAATGTPIIVLSGQDDEEMAVEAVREGAQDYLVKGQLTRPSIRRAIRYGIERQRLSRALEESQRHYKHLLESITDYSYSVQVRDGQAAGVVHGPGCRAVTGYQAADYASDADLWHRMIHEVDRPAVLEQTRRALAGESPPPLEHRIFHKNGQVRWVRSTVVPLLDGHGAVTGYDGLVSDITERKQAEEKLVASEAFYHSLVENLPQNIFRKDLSERFTFANQRFCQMLNRSLDQIIGRTDFDFYPAELASKYQRDDREVIRQGKFFETVEENVSPTGEKIYVQVVKTPIYDAKGQILGTQCIFWDITEQKRYEERLQRANAELASSSAALRRSHEELKAAQLQLIQAEKMESIGTLAAGVAHEVKNPLAILMMGVNFLARKVSGTDENTTLVLTEMREAINRADAIARGLLDHAASKQFAVKIENLNDLIGDALRMVRHALNQHRIELVHHFADRLPGVAVDRNQIHQVFVNLFMNAIHAMPGGGVLTVRTGVKSLTETTHHEGSRQADHLWAGDTAVVAEVEDTGTGIPQEYLAKIFDPFFTTKPTGIGTGLGLPVTKKIVELHGGRIEVNNKPGGGGVLVTVLLKARKD